MAKRKPKPKDAVRCALCRYYVPRRPANGDCRRFPFHENKTPGDWCGEWQRKPDGERITE
jgi:hypothetical protein